MLFINFEDTFVVFGNMIFCWILALYYCRLQCSHIPNCDCCYRNHFNWFLFVKKIILNCIQTYYFLLLHCASNQSNATAVIEDKINKPYRPIPSNLVTVKEGKQISYMALFVYLSLSILMGYPIPGIVWCIQCYVYNILDYTQLRCIFCIFHFFIFFSNIL